VPAPPPLRTPRSVLELVELCERDEPASIMVAGPANEVGRGRSVRSWIVGAPGEECGAATLVRVRPELWVASAVAFGPEAVPVLADLVRAEPVRRLVGTADHILPIAARWGGEAAARLPLALGDDHGPPSLDPRTRLARIEDVDAVVRLYRRFELEFLPLTDLRRLVDRLVRSQRVVVADIDGGIVGVVRCEARTRRWDWWSGLSVIPEHRGTGLGRALENRAWALTVAAGRRSAGAVADINPVPLQATVGRGTDWVEVAVPAARPSTVPRVWAGARRRRRKLMRAARRRIWR
jgi:GNAT superfamily N-acetyltransferase